MKTTANSSQRGWIVFAVLAGVGLLVAMIAIFSTSASPRAFIGKTYRCNFDPTEVDSALCTSNNSPSNVAGAIATDVDPVDRRTSHSNETIYLQYSDEIVAIAPDGSGGSRIEVDDYDTGYRKHATYISVFGWSSSRPSGSGFGSSGK